MPSPISGADFTISDFGEDACARLKRLAELDLLVQQFVDYIIDRTTKLPSAQFLADLTAAGFGLPTGSIVFRPVNAAPLGFLLANGQLVSRTTYAALFAVYGTQFSAGDGTTFGLPDLQNAGIFGSGDTPVGSFRGANDELLTVAQLPAHQHTFALEADGSPDQGQNWATREAGRTSPLLDTGGITSSIGGGATHNNVPRSLCGLWLVKY